MMMIENMDALIDTLIEEIEDGMGANGEEDSHGEDIEESRLVK